MFACRRASNLNQVANSITVLHDHSRDDFSSMRRSWRSGTCQSRELLRENLLARLPSFNKNYQSGIDDVAVVIKTSSQTL